MDNQYIRIDYNSQTGKVTEIPLTDAEIAQMQANDAKTQQIVQPTVAELQAQLATISAQLQALQGVK